MSDLELKRGQKATFAKQLNDFKQEIETTLSGVKNDIELIRKFKLDYIEGNETEPSSKHKIDQSFQQIQEIEEEAKSRYELVKSYHNELYVGNDNQAALIDTIRSIKIESDDKLNEISKRKIDLDAFYDRVFGIETDGKITKAGYQQKFESKLKLIEDSHKTQKSQYNTLFEQIEGLLPGATSVGLAKAFEAQKSSYANPLAIWSFVFICTIAVMLIFGAYCFSLISEDDLTLDKVVISIISKLPFFIPAIWLAIFSSKKQSQYKRLQQEYAFKETFAKSYNGHKKQIDDLEYLDEEQSKLLVQLLSNLIVITSENPSKTLDNKSHNDNPPIINLIEKFFTQKDNSKNNSKNNSPSS